MIEERKEARTLQSDYLRAVRWQYTQAHVVTAMLVAHGMTVLNASMGISTADTVLRTEV
jgi:hypothetical protein